MTDDTAFERDLRTMLAARDPGPSSADLAATVRHRLAAEHSSNRLVSMGRRAGTAVVAACVAVLILAIVAARPTATSPGAVTEPTPTVPYELQAGDGVVRGDNYPIAQVGAGVIVLMVLLRILVARPTRRVRIGAVVGIVILALVAARVGTPDAVAFGVNGEEALVPGGHDPTGGGRFFVDVVGDSPFSLVVTIGNTSRLPLEIEGLAEPPPQLPGMIPQARFVGLGLIADRSVDLTTAPRVRFAPTTLSTGSSVDLALLGMAGQCSISPSTAAGAFTWIDHVEIVYEQLTIRHTASVALPEPVYVSRPDHCP